LVQFWRVLEKRGLAPDTFRQYIHEATTLRGRIERAAFTAGLVRAGADGQRASTIDIIFGLFDGDGDGVIQEREWNEAAEQAGKTAPDETCEGGAEEA
jgi:Ca2+-binding EF-hand superfamily protein